MGIENNSSSLYLRNRTSTRQASEVFGMPTAYTSSMIMNWGASVAEFPPLVPVGPWIPPVRCMNLAFMAAAIYIGGIFLMGFIALLCNGDFDYNSGGYIAFTWKLEEA